MNNIQKAITALAAGGIIIYPTDTAFGIGCRIDNHEAVNKLFRIRRRPISQAMPVLVSSKAMALTYFDNPSDIVRRLMDMYWPGALTIVAPCKTSLLYSPIRAGGDTVGIRQPRHDIPCAIIEAIGVPILGPSANFHGEPTPYSMDDLSPELMTLVDYVVPGQCPVGVASTVVDCTSSPYRIIRQGSIVLPCE